MKAQEVLTIQLKRNAMYNLTTQQILSVFLGDYAEALYNEAGSLNEIAKMNAHDIVRCSRCSLEQAESLVYVFELARRRQMEVNDKRQKVNSSKTAYDAICAAIQDLPHEEFWVLVLNRSNQIMKKVKVSSGGSSGTVVDVKIIFKRLIEENAAAFIAVHNHPSGNLTPSNGDNEITKKMKAAGETMDITLLDHLIVGANGGYYSFADEGMI